MKFDKTNIKYILSIISFTIIFLVGLLHIDTLFDCINYVIGLFVPFIIGACLAFVINIPMKLIEARLFPRAKNKHIQKLRRPISILITVLLISTIILIVIILIVPELVDTFGALLNTIPSFANDVGSWLDQLSKENPQYREWIAQINFNWQDIANDIIAFFQSTLNSLASSTIHIIGNIVNGVMTFLIGFMFSMYILVKKEALSRQGKQVLYAYFPERFALRTLEILKLSNKAFSSFISGQCTEAIIIGVLFFVALTIFQFPYALLISVFTAFMSLIPVFGSYIASYGSAFLIAMTNPIQAIAFLVLYAVISQLEETFIYPYVVGNSVGLPSIWVLVAVSLGGSLMGIVGMLIFIPLASIFYTLFRQNVKKRLKDQKIDTTNWDSL